MSREDEIYIEPRTKVGTRILLTAKSLKLPEGFEVTEIDKTPEGHPYIQVTGSFPKGEAEQKRRQLIQWQNQMNSSITRR